jgi:hypothetical protein
MLWTLIAYIFFWMAFFCVAVTILLFLSTKSRAVWLKEVAARFGGSSSETVEIRRGFWRFGILFAAMGILIQLLTSPEAEPAGDRSITITFAEAACVVVILWQVKSLWEMTRAGREKRPAKTKGKR